MAQHEGLFPDPGKNMGVSTDYTGVSTDFGTGAGRDADAGPGPGGHPTVVVEQGRFCFARCGCGWRGPARRARSQARTDGSAHEGSARHADTG